MTNEIREEKINRKKIQSVTTNEIREEKITKKKHNPTTQLNPTRSNPTQICLGSWIFTFNLGCKFTNPKCLGWAQKMHEPVQPNPWTPLLSPDTKNGGPIDHAFIVCLFLFFKEKCQ